jgi:hypothetical protein
LIGEKTGECLSDEQTVSMLSDLNRYVFLQLFSFVVAHFYIVIFQKDVSEQKF